MAPTTRRAALGLALSAPAILARAQGVEDWPNRPIRLGGGLCRRRCGRYCCPQHWKKVRVAEIIGQQVNIDNRTGGNAVVAQTAVLQAPRDGQTFLIDAANQLTNEFSDQGYPFQLREDLGCRSVSSVDFPAGCCRERRSSQLRPSRNTSSAAKAKPDTISYGTPPAAGMEPREGEELQKRAGVKLIHTPYRGGADAARDIGAGAIDLVIITTSSIRPPLLASKKARVLAVTSAQARRQSLPDVPTLAESGFPGFDLNDWNGMFAAEGTPPAIIDKLGAAIGRATADPVVRQRMDATGAIMIGNTPAEFATWLAAQRIICEQVIREAGITLG